VAKALEVLFAAIGPALENFERTLGTAPPT
jgi:hypothetical protein